MLKQYMSSRNQPWVKGTVIEAFIDEFINYLIGRGYSNQSVKTYSHCIAHLHTDCR